LWRQEAFFCRQAQTRQLNTAGSPSKSHGYCRLAKNGLPTSHSESACLQQRGREANFEESGWADAFWLGAFSKVSDGFQVSG